MLLRFWGLLGLIGLLGCGSGNNPSDAGTDQEAWEVKDGGDQDISEAMGAEEVSSETIEEAPKALLVLAVNGAAEKDAIVILKLDSNGTLEDTGMVLETGGSPRAVAIRPDGREALVAYAGSGGPGTPKGIVVLELDPDLETAQAHETHLDLGDQQSPTDIVYLGMDQALVTMRGPDPDRVLTLLRDSEHASGFRISGESLSGEGPLLVRPHGPDQAVLLRCDFSNRKSQLVALEQKESNSFEAHPPGLDLDWQPLYFGLHPELRLGYVPSRDPETATDLNSKGVVYIVRPLPEAPAWEMVLEPVVMPNHFYQVAMAPQGDFFVSNDAFWELDPETNQPMLKFYNLVTVPLDQAGLPLQPLEATPQVPAYLIGDMEVVPGNTLVVAAEMRYPLGYWVQAFRQQGAGNWQPTGDSLPMDGFVEDIGVALAQE